MIILITSFYFLKPIKGMKYNYHFLSKYWKKLSTVTKTKNLALQILKILKNAPNEI